MAGQTASHGLGGATVRGDSTGISPGYATSQGFGGATARGGATGALGGVGCWARAGATNKPAAASMARDRKRMRQSSGESDWREKPSAKRTAIAGDWCECQPESC